MNYPPRQLGPELLSAALEALEARKRRIEQQIAELQTMLRRPRTTASLTKRRTMSAEGRARIAAAQKERWRKVRSGEKRGKKLTTGKS